MSIFEVLPTMGAMASHVNRMTPAKEMAIAMGFEFSLIYIEQSPEFMGIVIRGRFKCVCNKWEHFHFSIPLFDLEHADDWRELPGMDPAAQLDKEGAFSREHLEADGYKEVDINQILERRRQWEMEKGLREY